MTCKERQSRFSELIKGELNGESRIALINHIRACTLCRDEYLLLLKFHYTLEKKNITDIPKTAPEDFKTEIQQRLDRDTSVTNQVISRRLFTLVAILLAGSFLITVLVTKEAKMPTAEEKKVNESLVQMLKTENWNTFFTLITSPSRRYYYADEKVPLPLLIEKLHRLQKMGLLKIKLKYLLVPIDSKAATLRAFAMIPRQSWPVLNKKGEISTAELIFLLTKIARFKKTISLQQISEMYYLFNERMVKL